VALSPSVGPFMHRRVSQRALHCRRVIHLGTLKASGHLANGIHAEQIDSRLFVRRGGTVVSALSNRFERASEI
jgi:hypothetical protein